MIKPNPTGYQLLRPDNRIEYLIGFLCIVVYTGTLFFPLLDKDAAHHANIALHMQQTGDYASLIDRDKDYLDKPHLLFWATAAFFKIFGVTTIAHRLPALLFALISVYSVYKLTRHLSDRTTARMAAIILGTAQAFILSISDARMETPLTAAVIFGLWQLILYTDKRKFINLLLGTLGVAAAFCTKGWLGPVVIFVTLFFRILLLRQWPVFARLLTWLFIPLFFVFISPVLYAYYLQYDLHPEKVIRGRDNISGVRFILWGQLFERYKGFDEGGRYSDPTFLFHTFLWAFLPWCVAAYLGIVYWMRRMIALKKWKHPLNFAVIAFVFILVALSFSKFKMPHYLIMLFPLAAIFTAPYLRLALSFQKGRRVFAPVQFLFSAIFIMIAAALNFYFFKPSAVAAIGTVAVLVAAFFLFRNRAGQKGARIFYTGALASLLFNFLLNYNFFPQLLRYQGGNEMVKKMKQENIVIPDNEIVLVEHHAHSFDYYRGYYHPVLPEEEFEKGYPAMSDKYFLINRKQKKKLEGLGYRVEPAVLQTDYNVAKVKLKFLNEKTRAQTLDTLMLARVYK